MSLVLEAWKELGEKPLEYQTRLNYSGRFSDYNGNIALYRGVLTVNLSSKWKDVSSDIQIGMIQHLLARLFKMKKTTMAMDFYHSFLKNVHKVVEKKAADPILLASFTRVNDKFFGDVMEQPNLEWSAGHRRLGAYHYGSDTVTISRVLADDLDLLDYVMYHELLHKYHKFTTKNGRSRYHSTQFRADEAKYPGAELLEKRLGERLRRMGGWARC